MVVAQVQPGHDPARERIPVAVQTGRSHRHNSVADPDAARAEHLVGFDHADPEAREVVLVGGHHTGVLGGLATDERAARLHTTVRDAGDDLLDVLRRQPPDRDVVEEEQRLGAGHDDVVDDHRDQVDADGVVASQRSRDLQLGAHAVGRADQDRLAVPAGQDEQPAEAADTTEDLVTCGALHVRLDALDCFVCGVEVDAGRRVGVLGGVAQRVGDNRASTSLPDASCSAGTATGYSPSKQARHSVDLGRWVVDTSASSDR